MFRLHRDELSIEVSLVRQLVNRCFPEYADHTLRPLSASGSSNALFELGDDKLVRLPRQPGGGAGIDKEATWLPFLAARLTVEVPAVLGVGEPGLGYPERWAITTWLPGVRPARPSRGSVPSSLELARNLGHFLAQLRGMEVPERAKADGTLSWYRGLPLGDLDADFRKAAVACRSLRLDLDIDRALAVWDLAVDASRAAQQIVSWYHGDLLLENLLIDEGGSLAAVLDFGGLGVGSPIVDLVVAWEGLDDDGRRVLRRALDIDDATWAASRGWALFIAMTTFLYYGTSMPRRCADRLTMAQAAVRGT